jgi:hypothetical protein
VSTLASVPMKPEYGPTLGRILAPRWHATSRALRWAVIAGGLALAAALVVAALSLVNSGYSRGGRVPFGFNYRDLYRTQPDPGGYVKVQSHWPDGSLKYSFAVNPLRLPRYSGEQSAELPLYGTTVVRALARQSRAFALRGEGKVTVNKRLVGYSVMYTTRVQGRPMYGRDVLLLPPGRGVRDGVHITLLTAPGASSQIVSPLEVGSSGVLNPPLKTFAFG